MLKILFINKFSFIYFQGSKTGAKLVGGLSGPLSAPVTKTPLSTTTDDTPDFDRKQVSLEVPDQLFGSSFTQVTNVSKIFGDLITVSFNM